MRGAKPHSIIPGSSPVRGDLDPPDWLGEDARAEWDRVAPVLINERRTLTVADIASLVNYCVAVGQAAEASRIIMTEGMTYVSKGGPKKHPAVAIRSDAMTQARLLAGELGLTPVSRSRPGSRGDGSGDRGQTNLFDMDF
ncbi:phage terminase small subunit P27 family [Ancylobacter radicis]|nr:phage terminase small subunit P27 family [Ancylobacter radicis]